MPNILSTLILVVVLSAQQYLFVGYGTEGQGERQAEAFGNVVRGKYGGRGIIRPFAIDVGYGAGTVVGVRQEFVVVVYAERQLILNGQTILHQAPAREYGAPSADAALSMGGGGRDYLHYKEQEETPG